MRADSKRITRPEFNSTDAHNCAIEKENAHPIADGNQTKCNTDIHIKGMEQSVRKRKGKFANSKFVNARKRHHRTNDTDAFCVAHGNKRKRDDETNITVVNKTVDRAVTNTVKVQSKTSVLNTTAKKQKISVWLRGRTAADEDEWIENQKSIVLEWANSVLLTSLKGENGCLKNGEEIGACDPFTSLRKLGMEASWLYKGKKLLQRAEIQAVKSKLSKEIESGRLCIRKDRPVYVDVGLQEELFGLLNAYDPLWLALGLCTVLEPVIPQTTRFSLLGRIQKLKRNNDSQTHPTRLPAILRSLVLKHLIHDEKVAYNHRHVCKLKAPFTQSDGKSPRARWDGEEYFEELSNVMALKFLMLVLFLDQAQSSNSDAFTQFPCLFRSNSTHTSVVKQSQTIINEFCRLFLSNEGRIDRHLETLGFKLSYTQKPFDEIDPSIHDIGEDLRDGVRLAKLLEALTTSNRHKEKKLSEYLRIPTISRLQKVHNIQVCVYYLQEIIGFPALIESKDECNTFAPIRAKEQIRETEHLVKNLVDGSIRQRTKLGVELLWKLMSWFECEALVDVTMLKREIQQVQANMSTEAKKFFLESCAKGESDTLSGILLEWSRSVCANYSIVLRDLQLEDDALCALIHYYHPMLISRSAVENPSKELEKALQRVGTLPAQMHKFFRKNDFRLSITFVACLQSRLIGRRRELDAARMLCEWWRSSWIQSKLRTKKIATTPIERVVNGDRVAAVRIQRWWKKRWEEVTRCNLAALMIQKRWRKWCKQRIRWNFAALRIQKRWKKRCEERIRRNFAALIIQKWWEKRCGEVIVWNSAALMIQKRWRKWCEQRIRWNFAALRIQKWWKKRCEERIRRKSAVLRIQKRWKKRCEEVIRWNAARSIQRKWLKFKSDKNWEIVRFHFIANMTQKRFLRKCVSNWKIRKIAREILCRQSARTIQIAWKAYLHRQRVFKKVGIAFSVSKIGNFLHRIALSRRRSTSANILIANWKRYIYRKRYVKLLFGCKSLQKHFRRRREQKRTAAITLQTQFRRKIAQKRFHCQMAVVRRKQRFLCWKIEFWFLRQCARHARYRDIRRKWVLMTARYCTKMDTLWEERRACETIRRNWMRFRLNQTILSKIALRRAAERMQKRMNAAVRLQHCWKRYVRIKLLGAEKRTKSAGMRRKGAVLMQAIWRGYTARKKRICTGKMETRVCVPKLLTLGARLETALHQLLHGRRLAEVLLASHTIQVCTQYSHECCETCLKLTNVSKTIYSTIKSLNRSRPHVELLHQLLLIHRDMPIVFELATELMAYRMMVIAKEKDQSVEKLCEDVGRRCGALCHLFEKKVVAWDIITSSTSGKNRMKGKNGNKTEPSRAVIALKKIVAICRNGDEGR
ncbi:unnamed protein product [Albugo candida]|uniref:Calponin-homology (CH) domain-containing protein n=1 Tax=Albugo candida TaxID=65357 RepID=A0A024GIR0_9STRA|nr:unnamed protein product [Albugo candida]|eukprot:CCI46586.1 unnamed protein product [Albugo candida]